MSFLSILGVVALADDGYYQCYQCNATNSDNSDCFDSRKLEGSNTVAIAKCDLGCSILTTKNETNGTKTKAISRDCQLDPKRPDGCTKYTSNVNGIKISNEECYSSCTGSLCNDSAVIKASVFLITVLLCFLN
jgi:hypothetical protein